jgi:hypothetical protein
LVGLHDYSTSSEPSKSAGELKRCDLLYVYGEQEKEKLRKVCDLSKLSSGLDDNNGKPHSSSQSVSVPLDSTGDGIQFITSGTGIFNKYAKDESRRKGVVEFGKSGDSGVGTPGTNVISGSDWLTDLPPVDSDDDEDDVDEDEEDEDEDEDKNDRVIVTVEKEKEKEKEKENKNKKENVIDIDDI